MRITLHSATYVCIAIAASTANGQDMTSTHVLPTVSLEEMLTYPLPSSFGPTGIAASEHGSILVWSESTASAILFTSGKRLHITHSSMKAPLAGYFDEEGSQVELVDVETYHLLAFSLDGQLISDTKLDLQIMLQTAIRAPSGWIFGGQNASREFVLIAREPNGDFRHIAVFPPGKYDSPAPHLSVVEHDLLISRLAWPHTVARVSMEGKVVFQMEIPMELKDFPLSIDSLKSGWIGMPALALDGGYIQILSDTRSDRRMLLLYDAFGTLARSTLLVVPMAFAASVPKVRRIYGVRTTDKQEIVEYGWRWNANHTERSLQ